MQLSAAIWLLLQEKKHTGSEASHCFSLKMNFPFLLKALGKVGDFRAARGNEPQGTQEFLVDLLWLFALPQPPLRTFLSVENLRWIRQGEEKIFVKGGC